jgi:mannose-6-phosphate isomerase-like protein (cupin superfamily)
MSQVLRRSFLQMGAAALALPGEYLRGQSAANSPIGKAVLVPAGKDREGKDHLVIGVSHTTYKVLTAETAGAMFVIEQGNAKKGGPNRHLHHGQDELFYVMEGEYVVEVGTDRFRLKAGDCVLGPREVPHAWAFVGESTGRFCSPIRPQERWNSSSMTARSSASNKEPTHPLHSRRKQCGTMEWNGPGRR